MIRLGRFESGDKAESIELLETSADFELIFKIKWQQKCESEMLEPSIYSNKGIRKYDPDLLLDFYESKLQIRHNS